MKIVRHPEAVIPATYDLVGLTADEMCFLTDVLCSVGGHGTKSRRGHADALLDVLAKDGFTWDRDSQPRQDYEGSIRFANYK